MKPLPSFGKLLRQYRRARDLTQEELARRTACALTTIKKIESDERRPSYDLAERLAHVLVVPTADVATFLRLARGVLPDAVPSLVDLAPPLTPEEIGAENLRGHEVRGFALGERLGIGGFGAVYRAVQSSINREVAIKIILPRYADHPDFIRRFTAEAQFVARLEHPHIVPLYDYWREPHSAYLVMRYMRGGSLAALLRQGPLAIAAVLRILEQIGGALAAAHRINVVHRDLKPANILRDEDGNAFLADFGIAKDLRESNTEGPTQAGAIIGSPDYLSPEQVLAEPITPQTDIYSLGVMLYELLTAAKPFTPQTPAELLRLHLTMPLPSVRERNAEFPEGLDGIIQKATAKHPNDRFADVQAFVGAFRTLANSLGTAIPLQPSTAYWGLEPHVVPITVQLDLPDLENPYKGLRAFGEADARDFYGRSQFITALLNRLAEEAPLARFLAVVGPSGSGKSSVVRAGLVPALRQGGLAGSDQWFLTDCIPGTHPFDELELALLKVAVRTPIGLAEQLQRDARGLLRAARQILPDDQSELVIVIDQFEELFTLVEDEAKRQHILDLLVTAVTDPRSCVRIIVTLRADFYDRPLRYPQLGELMRVRSEVILPLTLKELQEAIVAPAARLGVNIAADLVADIARDVGSQPGALPLLQYALTELFEQREGRLLTDSAYRANGGVQGALARRAEELYQAFDQAGQEATRQLMLRLITLGEGVEDTRRRVRLNELVPIDSAHINASVALPEQASVTHDVITTYSKHRLITFDSDPATRTPTVEVAHEALIRSWPRLRNWIDTSRDELRIQRRLAQAAADWQEGGYEASFLARGAALNQFGLLRQSGSIMLSANEQAFIASSLAEQARSEREEAERYARELEQARLLAEEQQQRAEASRSAASRLRYLVWALAIFLIGAVGLILFAFDRQREAVAQRGVAEQQRAEADQQRQLAQANLQQSEAQRIAAEANRIVAQQGNASAAILLAIKSMTIGYTPQGDEALASAARMDYPIATLTHPDGIRRIHYSPDGKLAASASNNGEIRIWEMPSGRMLHQLKWHENNVLDLRFSADGRQFVSCGFDGKVILGDVATATIIRVMVHGGEVRSCDISPDGTIVASASQAERGDRTVRIWDAHTSTQLRSFESDSLSNLYLDISPDGKLLAVSGNDLVPKIYDLRTGALLQELHGHTDWSWQVVFTPDSHSLVTASFDKTARLWDVATGREIRRFSHPLGGIYTVDVSADGRYLITGGDDHIARLWDMQTGQELRSLNVHADFVTAAAIAPDGNSAITAGLSENASMAVWDLTKRGEVLTFPTHTVCAQQVQISADDRLIATAGCDAIVRLWDASSGQLIREFSGHTQGINRMAMSPDGKRILTGSWDHTVRLWDTATGSSQQLIEYTNSIGVAGIATSADGRYAVAASWSGDHSLNLFDLTTGKQIWQVVDAVRSTGPIAFSSDGKLLAHRGDRERLDSIFIRSADTGKLIREISWPTWALQGELAISPDGTLLAGAGVQVVDIWNMQDPSQHRQLIGHTDDVRSLAFSSDGRYLVSGSLDGTARLWDLKAGREIRRFSVANGGIVQGVVISHSGRFLYSVHDDGWLRMWDIDYHTTIDRLCTQLLRDFTPAERAQYAITDTNPTCPAVR